MTTRTELESKIVQLRAVYDPEYYHHRQRIHEPGDRLGRMVVLALCEDGSVWRRAEGVFGWHQLHPPHRAPEVKETPPAVKPLRFSEVTKPGGYWVRSAVNAKWGFGVFRKDSQGLLFEFSNHIYEQTESPIDMFQGYQFVGPLPEPEVKP